MFTNMQVPNKIIIMIGPLSAQRSQMSWPTQSGTVQVSRGIAPLYSLDISKLNCFAKGQKECKLVVELGKILNSIFPTLHPRLPT